MSRPYGKISRKSHAAQPALSSVIQINIAGRHTLEQFSLELQRAVARLQEHDVYGVQQIRIRLEPLDEKGGSIALYNDGDEALPLINIPDQPPEPPYRA